MPNPCGIYGECSGDVILYKISLRENIVIRTWNNRPQARYSALHTEDVGSSRHWLGA